MISLKKVSFKAVLTCLLFIGSANIVTAVDSPGSSGFGDKSFFPATKGRSRILLSQKWSRGKNGVGRFEMLGKYDPAYKYIPQGPSRIIEGSKKGELVILDRALCRIKVYNTFQDSYRIINWHAHGTSKSPNLIDAAVTSRGDILVLDKANGHVQKYSDNKFVTAFGDFSEAEQISVDSSDRVFVKDAGLPGILVFTSSGEWIGKVRTGLFQEHISPKGDVYGIKMNHASEDQEAPYYSLMKLSVFNDKNELDTKAKHKKLIDIKGFKQDNELLGVQFIGLDKRGNSYLAVTEGLNGKPLVLSLVRYDSMGRIESRMEIEPLVSFNIDASFIFVRAAGEIMIFDPNPQSFVVKAYSLD
jgi:hypothetical protein